MPCQQFPKWLLTTLILLCAQISVLAQQNATANSPASISRLTTLPVNPSGVMSATTYFRILCDRANASVRQTDFEAAGIRELQQDHSHLTKYDYKIFLENGSQIIAMMVFSRQLRLKRVLLPQSPAMKGDFNVY